MPLGRAHGNRSPLGLLGPARAEAGGTKATTGASNNAKPLEATPYGERPQIRQAPPSWTFHGRRTRREGTVLSPKSDAVASFIPLAEFKPPPMPTQEVLRRYLGRLQALLGREEAKPFIADDKLKRATLDRLNEVVAPPACGPLLDELEGAIRDWRAGAVQTSQIKVVVLPPCDDNDIVETWGRQAGHQVLEAPTRDALIVSSQSSPDLAGDGVLVIPRLEAWFLRHRNGLRAVRHLLAAVDVLRRPVVIGCNSWAWALLGKAVGADLLLPSPITFRAVRPGTPARMVLRTRKGRGHGGRALSSSLDGRGRAGA